MAGEPAQRAVLPPAVMREDRRGESCGEEEDILFLLTEPDARIDEGDQQIREQIADQGEDRREHQEAHDNGIIAVAEAIEKKAVPFQAR